MASDDGSKRFFTRRIRLGFLAFIGAGLALAVALRVVAHQAWVAGSVDAFDRVVARLGIQRLTRAVQAFAEANDGRFPDTLEALARPDAHGRTHVEEAMAVLLDPWGNPFQYHPPSERTSLRIFSYGRDGQPGGEGHDADIDNESLHSK